MPKSITYGGVNNSEFRLFFLVVGRIKIKKSPRPIYGARGDRISNPHPGSLPHAGEEIHG